MMSGIRTDVLDNVPKSIGIKMAVRSMAPKVIIADEIGNNEDAQIVDYAVCSGVRCIFTAHGNSMEDLIKNEEIKKLIDMQLFKKIIFLDSQEKGKVRCVVNN